MFRLFGKRAVEQDLPPPRPERLTYVVGDIHGCADLLESMLARIETDRAGQPADLVFVGDYVDRGPDSAAVLRRLASLSLPDVRSICLMGNHERMMLDFLNAPDRAGDRWLNNGGAETLNSFVLPRVEQGSRESRLQATRDQLRDALGANLEAWLRQLPLAFLSGTLGCVHAITDPSKPWYEQTPETLLWGRPHGQMRARPDGIWVAHGHTIVPEPTILRGRIALDTGAYRSGVMTALRCDGETQVFLKVSRRA